MISKQRRAWTRDRGRPSRRATSARCRPRRCGRRRRRPGSSRPWPRTDSRRTPVVAQPSPDGTDGATAGGSGFRRGRSADQLEPDAGPAAERRRDVAPSDRPAAPSRTPPGPRRPARAGTARGRPATARRCRRCPTRRRRGWRATGRRGWRSTARRPTAPRRGRGRSSGWRRRTTASIVARPTARWSELFQPAPGSLPQRSPKCWATTTSGRWRRIAAAMSRRRSSPSTTRPSGWPRNSISRHADDRPAGPLLRLAGGARRRRRQRVDAGLAGRDEHVRHLLAGRRPRGDGAGDAPLDVVGVGDDHRRLAPAVGELGQRHRSALEPAVDDERLAGHVRRLVRQQEQHGVRRLPPGALAARAAPGVRARLVGPATPSARARCPSGRGRRCWPGSSAARPRRRCGARARRAPPSTRRTPGSGCPA